MKSLQKAFIGVATSICVATVAVLGRPYIQQVLMSQQYQRKLSVMAAEYRADLRDANRMTDELATAFFESRRDYFRQQVNELGLSDLAADGAMENMLQVTKKVTSMELRINAMRRYLNRLRVVGAKREAAALRQAIEDQQKDNNDDYIPRMRQSGFPVDDLLNYLRQNMPKND